MPSYHKENQVRGERKGFNVTCTHVHKVNWAKQG